MTGGRRRRLRRAGTATRAGRARRVGVASGPTRGAAPLVVPRAADTLEPMTATIYEQAPITAAAQAPVALENVTKQYGRGRGAVTALDDVSLSFPAGSVTAVLGVSGSGKSTLLQCAAGLERPTSGTVRFLATDLAALSRRRQAVLRRRRIGFVFQDLNLVPELSVAENIALPLRLDHRRAGGPTSSWPRRGWGWAAASCGGGPPNSPAASSSGWRSPGR
jgi:ABC-type glutathione transport system ATPase component